MCTPIGHTLAGATLLMNRGVPVKPNSVFGILFLIGIANLPDVDYLFGFLEGNPNLYHHGWTHSLFFVVFVGCAAFGVGYFIKKEKAFAIAFMTIGILMTHLILDFFTVDTSAPFGMQIFWPVSKGYYLSFVTIFGDLHKSASSSTFFQSLFVWHNLKTVVLEIVVLSSVLTGVRLFGKRRMVKV